MNKVEYAAYLLTPEWKVRREAALGRAKRRCQLCNSRQRLHVHHRTYERVGAERDEDLTVLCSRCHERFHGIRAVEPTHIKPLRAEVVAIPKPVPKALTKDAQRVVVAVEQMRVGRVYTTHEVARMAVLSPNKTGPRLAAMAKRGIVRRVRRKHWARAS